MRTPDEIAAELAKANEAVEACEAEMGAATHATTDAMVVLHDARDTRDRLRLELREAIRVAGDTWPDPGGAQRRPWPGIPTISDTADAFREDADESLDALRGK